VFVGIVGREIDPMGSRVQILSPRFDVIPDAKLSTLDRYAAGLGYVIQYQLVAVESAKDVPALVAHDTLGQATRVGSERRRQRQCVQPRARIPKLR
jgi:hypothetical protein